MYLSLFLFYVYVGHFGPVPPPPPSVIDWLALAAGAWLVRL